MKISANFPLVFLMGPTASGKTQLAVELVQKFPFEIVSVDSAMIYRGMDISTAKPGPDILKIAPHRLINILEPSESFGAAEFRERALQEIADIYAQGKIPLLVGGTMLYFKALQYGLSDLPSANPEIREKLQSQGENLGWEVLHERLQKVDPETALRIHPNDSQRIQRALEVYEITGIKISLWQQKNRILPNEYRIFSIAISPDDRTILHKRIALRFAEMLKAGLVDEIRELFARPDLDLTKPAVRAVGVRQVWEYLSGNLTYDEMHEKGIIATRQLAKRQLTWLRSWQDLVWFDSEDKNLCEKVSEYIFRYDF